MSVDAIRWREIRNELQALDVKVQALQKEAAAIRKACAHAGLPHRNLGEEYADTCPDCGFLAYCYRM